MSGATGSARSRPLGGWLSLLALSLGLGGCLANQPQPLVGLNRQLESLGDSSKAPSLNGRWLALITSRSNRTVVDLVDLETGRLMPLPGLNRPDALPLAVSVDSSGNRLAVIRQLEGRTELLIHRPDQARSEPLTIAPAGVPQQVALSADGRTLAVQVSRLGRWQIDLISLP